MSFRRIFNPKRGALCSLVGAVLLPAFAYAFEPFIVKATIDAAVIAGAPSSKAARKYASLSQRPEFLASETYQASETVSWRRLYFRKYFSS